jgi:hypothetical protein
MQSGHYYRMIKFPERIMVNDHAFNYCKNAGLNIGGVYKVTGFDRYNVFLDVNNRKVELGITFFEQHFIRSYRNENLEKLGI